MLITNFSSGELSPTLNGRVDLQQYYQGCGLLKNFEIIPTGGIKRRIGTQRLVETDGKTRLIPFIINKNTNFLLELKPYAINIWQAVGSVFSVVTSIETEYASMAVINEIHYAQNYDTIILCHRNHRPFYLEYKNGSFNGDVMNFDFDPDVNLDDDYNMVMIPKGADKPTYYEQTDGHMHFEWYETEDEEQVKKTFDYAAGVTKAYCVFQGKLWEYDKNGTAWVINGVDPEQEAGLFTTANNYPGCVAFFNNRLFFASTINKRQKIWASAAPDAHDVRYNDFCTYQKYVTVSQVVKDADLHIFTCDIKLDDLGTYQTTLTNVSQDFTQAVLKSGDITDYYVTGPHIPAGSKILSVTSNSIVIDHRCDIAEDQANLVCSIQLWQNADVITASDYEYQIVNQNITTADCSFNFELASSENDAIMFLSSGKYLAAGTESSIWSINPDISALNIAASMQGRYGSDDIQGQAVAAAQIYFAQGKKGIREFYYDNASEAFQTNNIAIQAEQMLNESEIVDFDYITNPYNRLLCLRKDGAISSLLYDKTNGVLGWSRIVRGQGKIVSVAVTRGNDEYDIPYFLVEDNGRYYIEVMYKAQYEEAGTQNIKTKEVYLDSWAIYDSEKEDPLDGYTEDAVLWNESTEKECMANDIPEGFITSDNDVVYIGYKFESQIKSLPVLTNDPTGKKRITALLVRLLNSYLPVMKYEESEETFSGVTEPYSGIIKMTYPGVYDRDVTFEIRTDKPQNVVILAVNAQLAN